MYLGQTDLEAEMSEPLITKQAIEQSLTFNQQQLSSVLYLTLLIKHHLHNLLDFLCLNAE